MILVNYWKDDIIHFAFLIEERLYNCHTVHPGLPDNSEQFLTAHDRYEPLAKLMDASLLGKNLKRDILFVEIGQVDKVVVVTMPEKLKKE